MQPVTQRPNLSNDWIRSFMVINFDLEFGQKLDHMYPPINLLESEITNICFLSFPETTSFDEGDTIYSFRMPRHQQEAEKKKKKYLHGFVFFRQRKDSNISRGYLQKSLLVLSIYPFDALFKKLIGVVAPLYFEHGNNVFEKGMNDILKWPSHKNLPSQHALLELPVLDNLLRFDPSILDHSVALVPMSGKLHSLEGFNLFTTFSTVFQKTWVLWELVLLCEPILVLSPSPDISSSAVLNLTSLIHPSKYAGDWISYFTLHDPVVSLSFMSFSVFFFSRLLALKYAGDWRSYFTLHDPEYNKMVSLCTKTEENKRGVMIGVTNPIFRKEFSDWPHILILGNETKMKPEKKIVKPESNELVSSYKRLSTIDPSTVTKKLLKKKNDSMEAAVNNELVRRHFSTLTATFMAPLEVYLKTLVPAYERIKLFKKLPSIAPFKEADFLQELIKQGKKTKEIELYRRFIRTPNFVLWFRTQKQVATTELGNFWCTLLEPDMVNQAIKGKSDIQIIDYFQRLKDKLFGPQKLTAAQEKKVANCLDLLLARLPEELAKNYRTNNQKL